MKIVISRLGFHSAGERAQAGRSAPKNPLWRRIVLAAASPAARWAGIGTLTLMAVLIVATFLMPVVGPGGASIPGLGLVGWGYPSGMTCDWYLRHRQWQADVRTTVAVVRYVLSPDFDSMGSRDLPPNVPFLSATTNRGTNLPPV